MQGAAAADDPHDGLVGEVGAVCEDEAAQVLELVDAPAVEAGVGDGGAARKVQALEAVGGVVRDVRHAAVLDVFAVAEGEALEFRGADDAAWGGRGVRCRGWL